MTQNTPGPSRLPSVTSARGAADASTTSGSGSSSPSWRILTPREYEEVVARRSQKRKTSHTSHADAEESSVNALDILASAAIASPHATSPNGSASQVQDHHQRSSSPTTRELHSRTNRPQISLTSLPVPLHSLINQPDSTGLTPGPSTTAQMRANASAESSINLKNQNTNSDMKADTSGWIEAESSTPSHLQPLPLQPPKSLNQPLSGSLFNFEKFLDSPAPLSSTQNQEASALTGGPSIPPSSVQQRRSVTSTAPARTLCLRHSMMANQDASEKLQKSLDAFPISERAAITALWSTFSTSSHAKRRIILEGILTMCCFSQLSELSENLSQIIRIDPFSLLPKEVCLRVLGYLDAISLGKAAQVSRLWKSLADDDLLWRRMCGQHIERKCRLCGWALPLLERRRLHRELDRIAPQTQLVDFQHRHSFDNDGAAQNEHVVITAPRADPLTSSSSSKRSAVADDTADRDPCKRRRLDSTGEQSTLSDSGNLSRSPVLKTKPWKQVYCERLVVERNWRKGRYLLKSLKLHTNGVMCLQLHHNLANVDYPVLITGSYDRTAIVWRLDTFEAVHILRGHTRPIRGLQFDSAKLITAGMDATMRIWNWKTGTCLRTLQAPAPVICLNYDQDVLASGLADGGIKVFDFSTSDCFQLRGHTQSVNAVLLWDGKTSPVGDRAPLASRPSRPSDPKYLLSASDDTTINIWDVQSRSCLRTFTGHLSQVQSLGLVVVDKVVEPTEEEKKPRPSRTSAEAKNKDPSCNALVGSNTYIAPHVAARQELLSGRRETEGPKPSALSFPLDDDKQAILVSGGLDNLVKTWDVETGQERTFFGSLEGVWSVAVDPIRMVSGSHDRTIKMWNRDTGACEKTLTGHRGAVTCIDISDDMIVSGSDDGEVLVWNFAPEAAATN